MPTTVSSVTLPELESLPSGTTVLLAGDRLHLLVPGMTRFWHSAADIFFKDVRAYVHYGNDVAPTANDYVGVIVRRLDADNMLIAAVTGTDLHVMKFTDGVLWDVVATPLPAPLVAGADYWVQGYTLDNQIAVEHWDTDPRLGGDPVLRLVHDLDSTEIARFTGDYTYTTGVFWWEPDGWETAWLEEWGYEPVKMTDLVAINVDNNGNYTAKPIIEFMGSMGNARITNLMNGSTMVLDGTIPEGESWIADIADKTFVDSENNNMYEFLAQESHWVKLEKGVNQLSITTDSNRGDSGVKVTWRHSTV